MSLQSFFNLNRHTNGDIAIFEAGEILAARPEYMKDLELVNFSPSYFVNSFARYGLKWGIQRGIFTD